jgi:hypothetical protein
MAKAPRTEIVGGVGFPREEREEIEEMARRDGQRVPERPRPIGDEDIRQDAAKSEALQRVPGAAPGRKRVVRCFRRQGIRIEKATRQAVLGWYRLPQTRFIKLVELRGVEPLTPRLPALCSPN